MSGVAEGRKPDGTYDEIRIDKSRDTVTLDQAHHKIHDGKTWVHVFEFAALAASASVDLAIIAAAGKRLHVEATFSADNAGTGRIYKNPTYTVGSAVAGVNADFSIATASPGTVVSGPTVTAVGTLYDSVSFASGVGQSGGGQSGTRHEIIVTPTVPALLRFTAKNNATNGSITLTIYDEA